MRAIFITLAAVLPMAPLLAAQAISPIASPPPAPGMRFPMPDGVLRYMLNYSELMETGAGIPGGPSLMTTVSGDASYTSRSATYPFNMVYSGGWEDATGYGYPPVVFQNLALTQGYVKGRWIANVTNAFSYLPNTPSIGLAGLPGLGDLGVLPPEPGIAPSPSILSDFGTMVMETLTGNVNRQLTRDMYFTGMGMWGFERFLVGDGLNTNEYSTTDGLNWRLGPRTNVGGNFAYSNYSYSGLNFTFSTIGANFVAQHQWTRAFNTSISVGPQWISSSDSSAIPPSLELAVIATATLTGRNRSAQLSYSRGAMGGMGVIPGAIMSSLSGSVTRQFGRNWSASVTGTYSTFSGLGNASTVFSYLDSYGDGTTTYGGVQGTRSIGRSFSVYLSYTGEYQSFAATLGARNALNGIFQIFGGGLTFSPKSHRLSQF